MKSFLHFKLFICAACKYGSGMNMWMIFSVLHYWWCLDKSGSQNYFLFQMLTFLCVGSYSLVSLDLFFGLQHPCFLKKVVFGCRILFFHLLLHRSVCVITNTEVLGIWRKIFSSSVTMLRPTTWRDLRWIKFLHVAADFPLALFSCWMRLFMCVCWPLQIYEDSIVIKSVFESARQRIVTDEEQKETVSASHSNNGDDAEDPFVPSAGECLHKTQIERRWDQAFLCF